jgi:gamma-glutamyltranspeptidase / glutathione hydrolase
MRGAIAAGHPLTAEAGARVLEAGGNAVDACVAATFTSWVTESPLTGPGGGGFLLLHHARERRTRLFDFFVAVPGRGVRSKPGPMDRIDVIFEGDSTQVFNVGPPTVAVPGNVLGLETAHRAHGSLPWRELLQPAIELARGGVKITPEQGYLHAIIDMILRGTPEARKIYGQKERLKPSDTIVLRDLANTLERIGDRGARDFYAGELSRAIVAHVQAGGGVLTRRDLAEYRVVRRRPVHAAYRGHEFRSNPPPSSGGVLIAYGLQQLESTDNARPGSAKAMAAIGAVMRKQDAARDGSFASALYRGGLARRLLTGTTHISVVDGNGDAASLSSSLGSGSGVFVPGTGIHLNNMLGEFDLVGATKPGLRLTSMMAPSVVLAGERPRLVIGSAGSARLRGAIMQVIVNVIANGLDVRDAIECPRVHLEGDVLHCEGGADAREVDRLEALGWDLVRWQQQNLYFGGVSAVELRADGSLAAAGDPRRGGAGVVVE